MVIGRCSLKVHKPDRVLKEVTDCHGSHFTTDLQGSQLLAECQGLRFLCCVLGSSLKPVRTTSHDEVSLHEKLIGFVAQLRR
jgi:hypothetical protein